MFKLKHHFFVGLVIVALSLGAISCTPGDTTSNIESLQGILEKVDSVSGDVTVTLKDGSMVTFNLNDVNVGTIRKALGNASLVTGNEVTVDKDKDGKVKDLKAHASEAEGLIKSLDLYKQKLTITLDNHGQLTFYVTNTTQIVFGSSVKANFGYLKTGQKIEVIYDVESKNALRINIEREKDKARSDVKGKITMIDRGAKTVTIQSETGVEIPPLKVISTTKLWVDKACTFESLYIGMEVKVKFNPETNELLKLEGKTFVRL